MREERVALRLHGAVKKQDRNRGHKAELRRDERLGDAARQKAGLGRAVLAHHREGLDHAAHGPEQTEKRRNAGEHRKRRDAALEPGTLGDDRRIELRLEEFVRALLRGREHAAERIVLARILHVLELSAHTPFLKGERRPAQEAQKKRRSSHESDEDADDACGLHPSPGRMTLGVARKQPAEGRIKRHNARWNAGIVRKATPGAL